MTNDESYTTDDLVRLLKVSKLTVYDLIKKGELIAYRVGRQMRVDQSELHAYKERSREGGPLHPTAELTQTKSSDTGRQVVISGQDRSLDILARELEKNSNHFEPLRSQKGSLDRLMSLYDNPAQIVSTHLYDGETGEYNVPYAKRLLVSHAFVIIHFIKRKAGLYVKQGNPHELTDWRDLGKPNIRLVNREVGAGARALLDEQLRLHHMERKHISGYATIETSHLAIASAVATGRADVGIGIEQAAQLAQVDFVPLIEEQYDLVIVNNAENAPLIEEVIRILRNTETQEELAALGYDTAEMGTIIYEQ